MTAWELALAVGDKEAGGPESRGSYCAAYPDRAPPKPDFLRFFLTAAFETDHRLMVITQKNYDVSTVLKWMSSKGQYRTERK